MNRTKFVRTIRQNISVYRHSGRNKWSSYNGIYRHSWPNESVFYCTFVYTDRWSRIGSVKALLRHRFLSFSPSPLSLSLFLSSPLPQSVPPPRPIAFLHLPLFTFLNYVLSNVIGLRSGRSCHHATRVRSRLGSTIEGGAESRAYSLEFIDLRLIYFFFSFQWWAKFINRWNYFDNLLFKI